MGGDKTKIDLEQLRFEIQHLNLKKALYHVLKEELTKKGYWKAKPRGSTEGIKRLRNA